MNYKARVVSSDIAERLLTLFPEGSAGIRVRMLGTNDEIDSVLDHDGKRFAPGERILVVGLVFPTMGTTATGASGTIERVDRQTYSIGVLVLERVKPKSEAVRVWRKREAIINGLLLPKLVEWCDARHDKTPLSPPTDGYCIAEATVTGGTFAPVPDLLARGWIAAGANVAVVATVNRD